MYEGIKQYFSDLCYALADNLTSIKVWFFMLPFMVSTIFLGVMHKEQFDMLDKILTISLQTKDYHAIISIITKMEDTFIAWCTFTISLAGTIIVIREVSKISKINAMVKADDRTTDIIGQIKT